MTDQKTISVYNSQVEAYAKLINELPADTTLLGFIDRLKTNDYVLDLGCGPASSSATMREHGLRIDPVDASEEMIKLANKNFEIGARLATFNDVIIEDNKSIYDGIWANFSLLHATHTEFPIILNAFHQALKPEGLLHIGMKIGQGSKRDSIDRLYSYYSEKELKNHLSEAGFSIVDEELGEDMGLAGVVEPWIAITSLRDR